MQKPMKDQTHTHEDMICEFDQHAFGHNDDDDVDDDGGDDCGYDCIAMQAIVRILFF